MSRSWSSIIATTPGAETALTATWWLFDTTQVVVMRFTPGGKLSSTELLTDAEAVSPYRRWRELALQHATEDAAQQGNTCSQPTSN